MVPFRVADTVLDDVLYGVAEVAEVHTEGVVVYRALDPPSTPSNLRETATGTSTITWKWSASTDADHYQTAFRRPGGALGGWGNVSSPTRTIYGLRSATTYEMWVKAVNAAGSSDAVTDRASTRTGLPSTPSNLRETARAQKAITWRWDATTYATSYQTAYRPAGSQFWTAWVTTTQVSRTIVGLRAGTNYEFRVRAVNSAGNSGIRTDTASTTAATAPGIPQNLRVQRLHPLSGYATRYRLSWSRTSDGGSPITRYETLGRWTSSSGRTVTDTTWVSWGLVNTNYVNSRYSYASRPFEWQVRAVNALGASEATPWKVSAAIQTPSAPTSFRSVRGSGSSQLGYNYTFYWSAPTSNGGAEIVGYEGRFRNTGGTNNFGRWFNLGRVTEYSPAGLRAAPQGSGTWLQMQFRAYNYRGSGAATVLKP